ncbi:UNVERIFIED_CONTAM: hypothetical protein GTU68_014044 [Idotea baltica]|nr:hypothetical protein [Idotea baltica]
MQVRNNNKISSRSTLTNSLWRKTFSM